MGILFGFGGILSKDMTCLDEAFGVHACLESIHLYSLSLSVSQV